VADAHLLVAFDVVRDLRWRAREGTARPIGAPLGFVLVIPACTIREIYAGGIAARVLRMALDSGGSRGELLRGPQGDARVGRHGIPAVGETPRAAQRRRTFAAGPDGRVGLLHRLGRKLNVGEAAVGAFERGIILCP
jgi:hypothetical protein